LLDAFALFPQDTVMVGNGAESNRIASTGWSLESSSYSTFAQLVANAAHAGERFA